MDRLKINFEGYDLYKAGLPNFERNFTRDSIISAILMKNPEMLRQQLCFCAEKQGETIDPHTGEEPGKIFHEYPGTSVGRLYKEIKSENYPSLKIYYSTKFNACDSTALFLIGHDFYRQITKDNSLSQIYKKNIVRATEYIIHHLDKGLFYENPKFAGAKRFALNVTYWKDSSIISREEGQPAYPVVYTLAHIQNMKAIRSSSILLKSKELENRAIEMKLALRNLWDDELETFYLAKDEKGFIQGITSDSLHSLFYLNEGDLYPHMIKGILNSSKKLETKLGYRTMDPELSNKMNNGYHSITVWPFEQAIINIGAKNFGLDSVVEVSSRIKKYLTTDNEIFVLKEDGGFQRAGCNPQLWTIATRKYFNS